MSRLNVNQISPVSGINTVTIVGVASVTDGVIFGSSNIQVGTGGTIGSVSGGIVTYFGNPTGSGANLTNLPAANITGTLPAISGANLTNLNASNVSSGIITSARLGGGTASATTFLNGHGNFATAGNQNSRQVLERFGSLADGSAHVLSQGSITMQNVTATQTLTTTWADANGSVINYIPPTGTVQVLFEYNFFMRNSDATGIFFCAMSVDDTATVNSLVQLNATGDHHYVSFKSAIHIGATYTGGAAAGQYTSWGGSTKKLSVKVRDYTNSYDATLFDMPNTPHANWYTSGFASGTTGSSVNGKMRPYVGITAIGSPA